MINIGWVIYKEKYNGALWLIVGRTNSRLIVCAYLVIVGGSLKKEHLNKLGSFYRVEAKPQDLTGLMLSRFPSHQKPCDANHLLYRRNYTVTSSSCFSLIIKVINIWGNQENVQHSEEGISQFTSLLIPTK